jgi:hypothetical protein
MGTASTAQCRDCSHDFEVAEGPGLFCHVLHCDGCYAVRFVGFEEIESAHVVLEDTGGDPYEATVRAHEGGGTDAERRYDALVESTAGACACGGQFRFAAQVRCPSCRRTEIAIIGECLLFD